MTAILPAADAPLWTIEVITRPGKTHHLIARGLEMRDALLRTITRMTASGETVAEALHVPADVLRGVPGNLQDEWLYEAGPDCLMSSLRILQGTVPHIRIEHDTLYTGGDYSGNGDFAYVPRSLIDALNALPEFASTDEAVDAAFRKHTHFDSMHIVHYTLDEEFTPDGEEIETLIDAADEEWKCRR